jgi:hypothetical protein
MDSKKCQFCEHGNSADAKYCSECGGCLYLLPCPHCGAVTDVTAATCYQCQGQMQGAKTDVLDTLPSATDVAKSDARYFPSSLGGMTKFDALAAALPVAEAVRSRPQPLSRVHPRVIASIALLAVITAVGYFAYRQRFVVTAPNVPNPPASAGIVREEAPVADTALANTANAARPADGAAALSANPVAGTTAAPPAAGEAKAATQTAVSRDTKAVVAPAAGKLATDGGTASSVACAPAVAALGLCATPAVQAREAEADAVLNAANVRPPGAGTSQRADSARQAGCTQGGATLGLCAPASTVPAVPAVTHTQRKE